jgi:hypothetical protein
MVFRQGPTAAAASAGHHSSGEIKGVRCIFIPLVRMKSYISSV